MADIASNGETPAFVCSHVFHNERPVRLVSREDGEWQFLCGEADHHDDGHLVGLEHLVERDSSLSEVLDLPPDWDAEREDPGKPWLRTPSKPAS